MNYPVVSISTDEDFIILGDNYQTNTYWLEAEVGQMDFIFDFDLLESSSNINEVQFEIAFSSLNTDMMHILSFNLPIQQVTSNLQDVDIIDKVSMSNYPNPFNPETTLSFYLPEDTEVTLEIFNLKGQLVKRLVNDDFAKGNHQVVWKGNNQSNQQVNSGMYMYKLQTSKSRLIKKMILQK